MKKIKKIAALLFALAIAVSVLPSTNVSAKGETWLSPGDGWTYLDGTNIKIKCEGEILTISGTGELPDYDEWTLNQRPWNNTSCSVVMIDSTVSYIGSYEFYGCYNIKYIYMYSTTFINDGTAFEGISGTPVFRIYGNNLTYKDFNGIKISSLDSIKRLAQSNWNGASYILDTEKLATSFQQSTNPTITNVYNSGEAGPWNDVNNNGNGGVATSVCSIASGYLSRAYEVSAQRKYQGNLCYEAYGLFLGDYTYATSYNISLSHGGEIVKTTDSPVRYTLSIPSEYRLAGRQFALLAIGNGTVYTYEDLDSVGSTITFETDKPTTAYALVYK